MAAAPRTEPRRTEVAVPALGVEVSGLAALARAESTDCLTVAQVTAGRGAVAIGESRELGPGDLIVSPPGHTVDGVEPPRWRGWSLHVAAASLLAGRERRVAAAPLWARLLRPQPPFVVGRRLSVTDRTELTMRVERIARELRDRHAGFDEVVPALASVVLLDVARLTIDGARPQPTGGVAAQALAYIDERFADPISLGDVAVALARSTGSLARTVRAQTGRSVNGWIADRRMAEARRLLLATDALIDEVARRSGFTDVAYFRRRFKLAHGCTPSEWRRAKRMQP